MIEFTRRMPLWAGLLALGPGLALARCDSLTFSSTHLDMGARTYAALPASEVAGYRLMGSRTVTLNALCDDRPDARQLSVELPPASESPGLLRWGSVADGADRAGAVRVVVQQATAGGHAVPMAFTSGAPSIAMATQGPLVLSGGGTLSLDLRGVPGDGDARRSVLVNLQVQTLVKAAGFEPVGATPFALDMGISLP
jgi:hypothetical protein